MSAARTPAHPRGSALVQKISFRAICTFLGSLAWEGETTPNEPPPRVVLGPPNQGVLARLKASARTWNLMFSCSVKVLKTEKSTCAGRLVRMFGKRLLSVRRVNGG